MRILIVGAGGYIGSGLVPYFRDMGHEVYTWGRKEDLFKLSIEALHSLRITAVVNCAVAPFTPNLNYELDSLDEKINVFGARHLHQVLQNADIPLVHLSSKEVYGQVFKRTDVIEEATRYTPKFLVDDSQPLNPQTSYAKTKLMSEFILGSCPCTNIVRISSCFTDYDHPRGNWMVNLFKAVLSGKTLRLSGNGKQLRDPLHVHDLADLLIKILESRQSGLQVNAGSGIMNAISILEYVNKIAPNLQTEFSGLGDYGFVSSNRLAGEIWDWKPQVSLEERLPRMLENIRCSNFGISS